MQRPKATVEIPSVVAPPLHTNPCINPHPAHLGHYELIERVGHGASAEVWLARRCVMPGAPKPCALKIIHGRLAGRDRYRRMFTREARLALKLSHANLVSVFDAGEVEGRLFMALEWVDGVHLREFVQRTADRGEALEIPAVCRIVGELLQGLRYAHGLTIGGRPMGVVHRDVAPHNVLLSSAGEVKLADFGVARVVDDASSGVNIKGHTRYMAPEQFAGHPSQASDLFAVGAILHELLEGRRFREGLECNLDWHSTVARAPLLPLQRAGVPPALEALRAGLLEPNPEHRIATADEALEQLRSCQRCEAGVLRELYARFVGRRPRTGLTRPLPTVPPDSATSSATGRPPTMTIVPRRHSPSRPTRVFQPASMSPGLNSSTMRGHRWSEPRQPGIRRLEIRRWCRGLWGLAGALALTAAGLHMSAGPPSVAPPTHGASSSSAAPPPHPAAAHGPAGPHPTGPPCACTPSGASP